MSYLGVCIQTITRWPSVYKKDRIRTAQKIPVLMA